MKVNVAVTLLGIASWIFYTRQNHQQTEIDELMYRLRVLEKTVQSLHTSFLPQKLR